MFDTSKLGPLYEDYSLGATLPPLPSITLTEADNAIYRAVTGDQNLLVSDATKYPALREVVIAGHSAGGQVTHRYAAGGNDIRAGLRIRYVVANPSTYLFLGEARPYEMGFQVPDREACPNYDTWHYGLADLNSYMSRIPESTITDNLLARRVAIMVGTDDTGSNQLDVSCGANLQGPHRFARGKNLMRFMAEFYPSHHHSEFVVDGIAHSSRGMFWSAQGLEALFGG